MAKRKRKPWLKRGSWWNKLRLNRQHKDRLFRYLFRDKKYLLELYNALHDSKYTDPEERYGKGRSNSVCDRPLYRAGYSHRYP